MKLNELSVMVNNLAVECLNNSLGGQLSTTPCRNFTKMGNWEALNYSSLPKPVTENCVND